jgi:HEAT repeat protein
MMIMIPAPPAQANPLAVSAVRTLVAERNIEAIRRLGPSVLPVLVQLYELADVAQRVYIAQTFYDLGWKSPDAKRVLMQDVHTQEKDLRLQVQWALGRVSNDADVVDVLLDNMQHDANPLFRDKAACALASDQIHLSEEQKVRLYDGLIRALGDDKAQVRDIAIKALKIQTGQTKDFTPDAPLQDRIQKISTWHRWLDEYKSNL